MNAAFCSLRKPNGPDGAPRRWRTHGGRGFRAAAQISSLGEHAQPMWPRISPWAISGQRSRKGAVPGGRWLLKAIGDLVKTAKWEYGASRDNFNRDATESRPTTMALGLR